MVEWQIIKLCCVFAVIILLIWMKRPLYQAILAGILTTAVLHPIYPVQALLLFKKVLTGWSSMSILVILYLITFLQKMLEKRQQIKLAQQDLNGLFNNRRINAAVAPMFIGLMPSAAAMILCGDIVKEATDGYLDRKEQAFLTTWFRHIPESTLPTYSSVLLMGSLAGIELGSFMARMIVPMILMALLGYFAYLRKLPRDTGSPPSENRLKNLIDLGKHLWSLLLIIGLILAFRLSVVVSVAAVIALALVVYRFRPQEIKELIPRGFERRMMANTFLILVFKEFTEYTGVIGALPEFFGRFPIPLYLVFCLLFFFGGIVSGSSGIIALGTTMAFRSIPGAGIPLMVLLMSMCHAASQVSPTHVCLAVATEYFGVTMGELVRKTVPVVLVFAALMVGYYHVLLWIS